MIGIRAALDLWLCELRFDSWLFELHWIYGYPSCALIHGYPSFIGFMAIRAALGCIDE
jgi:hypothetical protein